MNRVVEYDNRRTYCTKFGCCILVGWIANVYRTETEFEAWGSRRGVVESPVLRHNTVPCGISVSVCRRVYCRQLLGNPRRGDVINVTVSTRPTKTHRVEVRANLTVVRRTPPPLPQSAGKLKTGELIKPQRTNNQEPNQWTAGSGNNTLTQVTYLTPI